MDWVWTGVEEMDWDFDIFNMDWEYTDLNGMYLAEEVPAPVPVPSPTPPAAPRQNRKRAYESDRRDAAQQRPQKRRCLPTASPSRRSLVPSIVMPAPASTKQPVQLTARQAPASSATHEVLLKMLQQQQKTQQAALLNQAPPAQVVQVVADTQVLANSFQDPESQRNQQALYSPIDPWDIRFP